MLLTGATGFVGPHAATAFAREGAVVRALVRSRERAAALDDVELAFGSLEDEASLVQACQDVDVVVHMAALTHARTDAEYHAVNAAGTARLIEAMRRVDPRPRRLVYLSSLAACGPAVNGRGVTQQDPPRPLTAYGRSKLAGERVVQAAADLETVIVRAPAVYGPRDTDMFHFFRLARWGVIPVPTGGARMLQLVHVTDLARALVRASMADGATGVYHVAEPRGYTWAEVGQLVGEAVGRARVRTVPLPAMMLSGLAAVSETVAGIAGKSTIFNRDKAREMLAPGWLCETEAARADLNFEAAIPLDEGLRATAQWYRENGWL